MNLLAHPQRGLAMAAALCAVLTASLIPVHASDPVKPAKTPDLQVQVSVPPTWRPFLDDDIAEALTDILQSTFKRRGYSGEIAFLTNDDSQPNPALPLLKLDLREWRISRAGNAECTLTATLTRGTEKRDLGIVTQTDFFWQTTHSRFGLARDMETADALEKAATGAMRDLYKRVAETALVAGFPPPKVKK